MEREEYHEHFTQLIDHIPLDNEPLCTAIGEIDENNEISYEQKIIMIKKIISEMLYN